MPLRSFLFVGAVVLSLESKGSLRKVQAASICTDQGKEIDFKTKIKLPVAGTISWA